ncbi:oxidoreductase [Amylibacter ulvae]|uniref:Oxidoreductase n=1 Tax=Paramylibacter ulvae TaxID=1651968 RepID=A0ABQ3D5A9_9RHOB|nr:FAD-binding oxidoreductase [Amylibacter ulvae]GHA59657.1 oxidoreductase [Amylibacter ulvae]
MSWQSLTKCQVLGRFASYRFLLREWNTDIDAQNKPAHLFNAILTGWFWLDAVSNKRTLGKFGALASREIKDVVIVGGGVFGLCAAYMCALRGMSVVVLEKSNAVGARASGGIVGAMSPHTPDNWNQKKQFQFDALCGAETFWHNLDSQSGMSSGYGRIGRVFPIPDERLLGLAHMRAESAKEFWQGKFSWSVLPDHPLIAPSAAPYGVVHDTMSARIYPARACQSLRGALLKTGIEIRTKCAVDTVQDNTVVGRWGEIRANAIVLAAGVGGFKFLDQKFEMQTGSGVKGQGALLKCDMGSRPQINAEGIYIIPHIDGTVGVGSTSETDWSHPTETDEKLDAVIATAKRICPTLSDAPVIKRWADLRPKARKRTPMLGAIPKMDGVYVALGGYKIGFGLAHQSATMIADMIQGKPCDIPANFTVPHHLDL